MTFWTILPCWQIVISGRDECSVPTWIKLFYNIFAGEKKCLYQITESQSISLRFDRALQEVVSFSLAFHSFPSLSLYCHHNAPKRSTSSIIQRTSNSPLLTRIPSQIKLIKRSDQTTHLSNVPVRANDKPSGGKAQDAVHNGDKGTMPIG